MNPTHKVYDPSLTANTFIVGQLEQQPSLPQFEHISNAYTPHRTSINTTYVDNTMTGSLMEHYKQYSAQTKDLAHGKQ